MYSDDDLNQAVEKGVLSKQSVDDFRVFMEQTRQIQRADEENFQLVSNFNDFFVTIAGVLVLVSAYLLLQPLSDFLAALSCAGLSWLLSEYFVRKRRMALPGVLFVVSFVVGLVSVVDSFFSEITSLSVAISTMVAAVAMVIHWHRFKVPITIAGGIVAVTFILISSIVAFNDEIATGLFVLVGLIGLGTFYVAMRWDISDPERVTYRTDVAFWLHLVAAPMMIHPMFWFLGIVDGQPYEWIDAPIVLVMYLLITMVSLVVDRRGLMVSALIYVLVTFSRLFQQEGVLDNGFSIIGIIMGLTLLLLAALWYPARRGVLHMMPDAIKHRVPSVVVMKKA